MTQLKTDIYLIIYQLLAFHLVYKIMLSKG